MAGWEVSRHPEWDMMYVAGLTAREIADRCHQNIATVHRHLRMREKYEPGFHAKHQAALASRDPDRPSTRWRQRLYEALDFQATHQRLPDRSEDPREQSLHEWILDQRNAYRQGQMSVAKIVLLEDLQDWAVDTQRMMLDEHWRNQLARLTDFVASTGRFPRYKEYSSEQERVLGVWLHTQHQRRAEDRLLPWRKAAMDAAFPVWASHT